MQGLVVEAALALSVSRLLVKYVPFRLWRDRLGGVAPAAAVALDVEPLEPQVRDRAAEIGRIVARTARRMPFQAVCLPQAMSASFMLRRRGVASIMFIGAAKGDSTSDPTKLHAWLRVGPECITGAAEAAQFTPVVYFSSTPSRLGRDRGRTEIGAA